MHDKLSEAAKLVGAEDGEQRAEIVTNTIGTDKGFAKKILDGYEQSDPAVVDLCPKPLAGEWADDPTLFEILNKIANKADPGDNDLASLESDTDDIVDLYEAAYTEAFWDQVIKGCKFIAYGILP